MKDFLKYLPKILKDVGGYNNLALIFDFDGVLSAIASTPERAFLSDSSRQHLNKLSNFFPLAIITGRTMDDVKKKVGLDNVMYLASHGLEWEENHKYFVKVVSKGIKKNIEIIKRRIMPLLKIYPGMVFEDKVLMLGIHYRMIKKELVNNFKKEIMSIVGPFLEKGDLRLDHNKKTFELRPQIDWDKGHGALFVISNFNRKRGKKFTPVYIGDSLTDEDAFKAINNSVKGGITVRVRPKKDSSAKYFLKSRKGVDIFLEKLVSMITNF